MEEKYEKLCAILKKMDRVAVAFSGGVDSTFLLAVAQEVLGRNIVAITALSDTFPQSEYKETKDFCEKQGISHEICKISILENNDFCSNSRQRCYICKKHFFSIIKNKAEDMGISHVLEGSNMSDTEDYRPGMKAIEELGIRSPLLEAGLTKDEIRALSKIKKLHTWDKPAYACLATRIPYGESITKEKLLMIENAEKLLMDMGVKNMRVRTHGKLARIEVMPGELQYIVDERVRAKIIAEFKKLGFEYVSLDLEGYKMGSMNNMLKN